MTLPDTLCVRRATPADAADIVRLALEIQDVHVTGHPELFKPGGGESHLDIARRMTASGQFYWIATIAEDPVGYAYEQLGFTSFQERMAVEIQPPDDRSGYTSISGL